MAMTLKVRAGDEDDISGFSMDMSKAFLDILFNLETKLNLWGRLKMTGSEMQFEIGREYEMHVGEVLLDLDTIIRVAETDRVMYRLGDEWGGNSARFSGTIDGVYCFIETGWEYCTITRCHKDLDGGEIVTDGVQDIRHLGEIRTDKVGILKIIKKHQRKMPEIMSLKKLRECLEGMPREEILGVSVC